MRDKMQDNFLIKFPTQTQDQAKHPTQADCCSQHQYFYSLMYCTRAARALPKQSLPKKQERSREVTLLKIEGSILFYASRHFYGYLLPSRDFRFGRWQDS